jgi:transcriptional antiterminator NusG
MESFESGDTVLIKAGPFADFPGIVQRVDQTTSVLSVAVEIFGRIVSVEVPIGDAEKLPNNQDRN